MRKRAAVPLIIFTAILAGCAAPAVSVPQPAPLSLPTAIATTASAGVTPTPLPRPGATPELPTPAPPADCELNGKVCFHDWDFPFQLPIGADGNTRIDPTYRFGGTQNGNRVPHHGVEFNNASGTPVLAVADGEVVFAGWDDGTQVSPWADYYGNVVVLRHAVSGEPQPVFSVYAHLSAMQVTGGQRVTAGEQVGLVGATGGAQGSHLHFEIRYGDWGYGDSLNPALFLAPPAESGILAVKITDPNGNAATPQNVRVQWYKDRAQPAIAAYAVEPYSRNEPRPVRPHPRLGETFVLDDLAAEGVYRLTFAVDGTLHVLEDIRVQPGRLTLVTITTR